MRSTVSAIEEKLDVAVHSMRAWRKEATACQDAIEASIEKMEGTNLKGDPEEMECREPNSADMKACQETTACYEATEADIEKIEPDPGMMQSEGGNREVPKEDALVKHVKGRKNRHRGWKIAAGRRGEPKELTRGICGSRRKLAATCRKVSRRARMA
jgi:hypothetical protein